MDRSHISLAWEAPESANEAPIKAYVVVMRESDKNKFKKVGQVAGDVNTITVNKIKEGRDYFFRVYAENEAGIGKEGAELDSAVHVPKKQKSKEPKEATSAEGRSETALDANKEERVQASGSEVAAASKQDGSEAVEVSEEATEETKTDKVQKKAAKKEKPEVIMQESI